MIRLILELDEDQETLLLGAMTKAATQAWHASVHTDLEPGLHGSQPPDGEDWATFWSKELAAAEGILAQLPCGALRWWREHLHDDDEGEDQ